ncbi:protein kinase [Streptomyces sp. S.PB5]|uniref:protein kinase domain-containing protein n=1 Tax=Streptomyces sp. S.PB5 TaxID=3020844 RepID=UPI0025B11081|nr:protein kinase [Streptomyces sp. S.PB5]MDN3026410.1 protein kinase [Streptomyces sp. S.PB5]
MEKLGAGDPQRIGACRLLARLGAGGMGQVYLARSDRGRTVAVKLVREELAQQEEFRARFRQEVQAARQVGGHWTAPVLDADTEAAVPWVATGYVAGPSLQQVVGHDHGALPERSVKILAAGLAHALKDIHAAGIVHRDLKPSNVLVTIDGPRVIDFGIARALETVTDGGLTRTGALVGSPGFMAPEQVRGDRITPACDVFCLGSVLAYAASGKLPFGAGGSGVHALMFRIAQEEPDLEGVPEGLADLVRACLKKDPAARPSLDRVLERIGAGDTVSGGRSRDPWLPSALVAQLGRHAVQLLEAEDPENTEGGAGLSGAAGLAGGAGPAGPAGPVGPAGRAGPVGVVGMAGVSGSTGSPGSPGAAGMAGVSGAGRSPGSAASTGEASPEHAPAAAEDASVPPSPGQPGAGEPLNHQPTLVGQQGEVMPPPGPQQTPAPGRAQTPSGRAQTPSGRAQTPASHAQTPPPAHPAYGYPQQPLQPQEPHQPHQPQQHPQAPAAPPAHGHPQQPWTPGAPTPYHPYTGGAAVPGQPPPYGPGSTPPYGPGSTPPYGPGPTPPYGPGSTPPYGAAAPYPPHLHPQSNPPRRNSRSTIALVAVALVVALGAGGSVYALMSNGGGEDDKGGGGTPTATAPTTPGPTTDAPSPSPSLSTQPSTSTPTDGTVPADYLGTWTATIDNAEGSHTRQLTLQEGEVGDTVLSLVADGPDYHCVFEADLAEEPAADGPLRIGPSTVTVGEPASSCSPGAATEITLLPNGTLERVNTGNGEKLTYTKQ